MIFADLDETLIVSPGGIGPHAEALIELAAESGGALIPVSARPLTDIAGIFRASPLVSVAIGSGGAVLGQVGGGEVRSVAHQATLKAEEGMGLLHRLQSR